MQRIPKRSFHLQYGCCRGECSSATNVNANWGCGNPAVTIGLLFRLVSRRSRERLQEFTLESGEFNYVVSNIEVVVGCLIGAIVGEY